MVESIAHVRFSWNVSSTTCKALAYDVTGKLIGELALEVPDHVRERMWKAHGHGARFRIEEALERNLRAMLELRY